MFSVFDFVCDCERGEPLLCFVFLYSFIPGEGQTTCYQVARVHHQTGFDTLHRFTCAVIFFFKSEVLFAYGIGYLMVYVNVCTYLLL